jgi:TatA/E family protein of Tat protein translocase
MFELFHPTHLLFVLLVALIVFGPKRLIEMSQNLGQTIRSLQEYKEELKEGLLGTSTEDKPQENRHSEKKG